MFSEVHMCVCVCEGVMFSEIHMCVCVCEGGNRFICKHAHTFYKL